MPIKTETELYAPVKSFFEQQGYSVRGEVRHCDLVAIRGEEQPVIVELKRYFSIPLLLQGIDRLRLSRCVYVAFELPNKGRAPHGASWPELRKLCQMLGIGMITVQFFKRKQPAVHIECHPSKAPEDMLTASLPLTAAASSPDLSLTSPSLSYIAALDEIDETISVTGCVSDATLYTPTKLPRLNKRAAEGIVKEFKERRADYNVGGSSKRKLMTSYREKALHLAQLLHHHGTLSPLRLRQLTGNSKAAGLLQKNYYRWFQRVERGVYRLSPLGEEALVTYGHVVAELPPLPVLSSTSGN
ncbi:DUF2161 family putative PD-(D/E)XK-type phosphodiesterase [Paenibacillus sp. WQ 127069]|uniref:DUF2161 family putative PD-(D/E)XK-type phosphodiesterase n=1 Tax=Paenibacillus baimaensis TaxID=2982185 RepID=A0ABT2UP02_9BACL|nr:DUF2161 family putative PD-(D/E)XK-type phosphodiesterase [Paenibacillus sp. WQ 127069]MCU6796380.1 DUF2161 family putative PD-(D/E)XK-type phosphodiesterase [Paenibacillus sp. WQ 127069]